MVIKFFFPEHMLIKLNSGKSQVSPTSNKIPKPENFLGKTSAPTPSNSILICIQNLQASQKKNFIILILTHFHPQHMFHKMQKKKHPVLRLWNNLNMSIK